MEAISTSLKCQPCGRVLERRRAFGFKAKDKSGSGRVAEEVVKCLSCALRHWPMIKRSLAAALLVGTVLTLLNQGDAIFSGSFTGALYWKVPLTYCVPFIVATYGALANSMK